MLGCGNTWRACWGSGAQRLLQRHADARLQLRRRRGARRKHDHGLLEQALQRRPPPGQRPGGQRPRGQLIPRSVTRRPRRQVHARHHLDVFHARHQQARALGLLVVAGQQLEGTAGIAQAPEHRAPVVLGPQFVIAAGRRHDHRVTTVGIQVVQARQFGGIQAAGRHLVHRIGGAFAALASMLPKVTRPSALAWASSVWTWLRLSDVVLAAWATGG